jgi:hypothetical protein
MPVNGMLFHLRVRFKRWPKEGSGAGFTQAVTGADQ